MAAITTGGHGLYLQLSHECASVSGLHDGRFRHSLRFEVEKPNPAPALQLIAGSNGQQVFDPEALVAIHRHANGIPRVVNLICEHCLVSAFVDQQKLILPNVVNAVARDFDLGDGNASAAMTAPAEISPAEKFDVVEVLRTLATLADRLRDTTQDLPKERKL